MRRMTSADDHAADAVDLLREHMRFTIDALDALDRKLALVVPVVGGIAVLAAPDPTQGHVHASLLTAGLLVATVAAALSLLGLLARSAALGPDPRRLAWRAQHPYPDYHRDTAIALQRSVSTNLALTERKARWFNLAAVSAACAILLFVIARVL
jgi:hypothetical protein